MGYLALIEEIDSNFFFGIRLLVSEMTQCLFFTDYCNNTTVVGCLMSHVQPDTLGIVYRPGDGAWCLRL